MSIKERGNNACIRIPAAVVAAAHLRLDQPVEVREVDRRVVIEPIRDNAYDLATLVVGITDENRHAAVDMGPPAGRAA